MKPTPDPLAAGADLKSRAEAARQAKAEVLPESLATLASDATQNELREKQIELQNEELRRAQHELATSRARYFDLYDLAPVGYLVVRESGLILQANLTAAAMLGEVRGALNNRPVSRYIFKADLDAYYLCRKRLVDTGEPQSCELRVVKPDGPHLWVLVAMSAACADDGMPLHRVTLTDIGESKRAEAAQRESEERLRVALTAAAAIGFVWDAASDAVVRYFSTVPSLPVNVDAPEPVAAVRARVHPDDVGLFDAGVAECLVMGTEYRNLYRVVDPAGSERWLQEWGTLSRDFAGRPLRLTGISIDVTERKESESKLLLADRVLKNVSQGVIVTGPDQMIVTANTAFTAITGYSEREIMGWNCKFLQGPGTDPVTVAAIRQALEDGNDFAGEILNYRKDGNPFWNELTITPVLDPQGVLTHFILITRDITERKRSEDELRHSSERFELVARGAVDGIWDWDVVTNADYFSGRWCELLGYTAAELLPHYQTWVDHLHPEDRPGTFAALQSHLEQRAPYDLEYRMRLKCGEYRWFRASGQAMWDADGKPLRMAGSITDITARRESEASLRVSENRVRFLVSAANVGLWDWDLATGSLYFSPEWKAQLGYTDHELPSRFEEWESRLHPEDRAATLAAVAEFQAGRLLAYDLEFRLRHRDGSWRWIFTQAEITRDASGRAVRMAGSHIDITERKLADAERRISQDRFHTLMEHSPYCIHEIDIEGRLTSMNRAGLKMIGADDVCSIQDLPMLDFVHDSDRERVAGLLADAIGGQASEFVFQTNKGLIYQSSFVPIADEMGTVKNLMGLTIDITVRKQTEQLLVANEARFRAIIDASPVPMAINDEELRFTLLNPAFVRTFGYDLTDIPNLADWWHQAYPDPVYRQRVINEWQSELARAAKTRTEFTPFELRIRCKDGTDRFVLASAAPLTAGFEQTHLVLLYDITERKRAEQSLQLAQAAAEVASRAKSEFLANMSHEIRTPLTAILGFADILDEDGTVDQTPHKRKQILDTIKNAGSHLLTVINDILDLSKIEAEKLTVEHIDTQLVNILCEVERLMLQATTSKGLVLSMAISSPLPDRILSDPTRLRQILMNLLGNAIKFTEAGTVRVTVGVEDQDRQPRLVIDIADTGPGMTPEQAQGLFTAFGQADSSVTRKHGGTGLGLIISRRLANILGGDVTLLYSELGKGSCFRLVLPFEQVAGSTMIKSLTGIQAKEQPKLGAVALTLSGRVLLAEDGLDNQRLIAFLMRKAGATVETADNGRIALDMLDQAEAAGTPFDMLLTDMQMPEMDGYCLASTLRDRGSKLPIIALTAHAMADDRKKCMDAGCDDYVSKPIDKATLIATCVAWMGKPGGIQ